MGINKEISVIKK